MAEKAKKGTDDEKLFAFLCYLLPLIGPIIVLATKSERGDFSIYHAKQGLVLFITWIIAWILVVILAFIPIIGWIIGTIVWLGLVVLWILGIINALTGKRAPLPIVGKFGDVFKF